VDRRCGRRLLRRENTLARELEDSFTAGIINLADRGFFSMHRWIRFSGRGAHLAWRVKNGAKSVPFKTLQTLADGSELVLLRESDSMLARRRRDAGDKTLPRLPDTIARLVSFTICARTARRVKTTTIKVASIPAGLWSAACAGDGQGSTMLKFGSSGCKTLTSVASPLWRAASRLRWAREKQLLSYFGTSW
jgi:hypothetical protein